MTCDIIHKSFYLFLYFGMRSGAIYLQIILEANGIQVRQLSMRHEDSLVKDIQSEAEHSRGGPILTHEEILQGGFF